MAKTTVYVDLVGDLFHWGHVAFLERARGLGDELVVGVMSDDDAASYKRRPILSLEERVKVVAGCRFVDRVLPAAPLVPDAEWIRRQNLDLVVHGDDFPPAQIARFYGDASRMGILRTVPYTTGISTSAILERIRTLQALTAETPGASR